MASLYTHENTLWASGIKLIAGVDEVGRGAWAGPLIAAAVILPRRLYKLRDSKVLKAHDRELIYRKIIDRCIVSVGVAEIFEINQHGLTWANHYAMKRAIDGLSERPDHLLVDYIRLPRSLTKIDQTPITDGDALSASIAAASIIAKVTRDKLMNDLHYADKKIQHFAFQRNFGYGTSHHRKMLMAGGPTRYHRQFYVPVVQSRQTNLNFNNQGYKKQDTNKSK